MFDASLSCYNPNPADRLVGAPRSIAPNVGVMDSPTHQLFFSYARKDNVDGNGWVTAFYDRLTAEHKAYTGRDLRGKIFFDKEEIHDMQDWRRRILMGLRQSRLFVAFLSPNFLASKYCRQEWEEYLRREHSVARGDDGIAPVYFITVPELHGTSLAETARADQALAAMIDDLKRRNQTRGGDFDLREWFESGPELLRETDAAERLAELRAYPQEDTHKLLPLAERVAALDRHITKRLDRCLLAELAPGNLPRSYPHFVGRHDELRRLHDHLIGGKTGLITALHGLGGLGKTALAVQYAFAYAEFYAAGGRWILSCEGKTSLAEVLETLAERPELDLLGSGRKITAPEVIYALERFTHANAATIRQQLAAHPNRETPDGAELPVETPRCLLIFDNVDAVGLFSADEVATHLKRAEWLEFIITTRLKADAFGVAVASRSDLVSIEVDSLPQTDALELLRDFQPDGGFPPAQEEAARELVQELGGYTLAVELAGAYLQQGCCTPRELLDELRHKGLTFVDSLATEEAVEGAVMHKQKQVRLILETTLKMLRPAERCILEYAACLPPDKFVTRWLREVVAQEHAELQTDASPRDWYRCWDRLRGLRLLGPAFGDQTPVPDDPIARSRPTVPGLMKIHRLVAAHVFEQMSVDLRRRRLGTVERLVADWGSRWKDAMPDASLKQPTFGYMGLLLGDTALHVLAMLPGSVPLASVLLATASHEIRAGLRAGAEILLKHCHEVFRTAQTENQSDDATLRKLAECESFLGTFYVLRDASGDSELALTYYKSSQATRQQLHARDERAIEASCGLAISENKLGSFYVHRSAPGDLALALECFQREACLRRELLEREPDSARFARAGSAVERSLAGCYIAMGGESNLAKALDCYERGRQLLDQVFVREPDSVEAMRELSIWPLRWADSIHGPAVSSTASDPCVIMRQVWGAPCW